MLRLHFEIHWRKVEPSFMSMCWLESSITREWTCFKDIFPVRQLFEMYVVFAKLIILLIPLLFSQYFVPGDLNMPLCSWSENTGSLSRFSLSPCNSNRLIYIKHGVFIILNLTGIFDRFPHFVTADLSFQHLALWYFPDLVSRRVNLFGVLHSQVCSCWMFNVFVVWEEDRANGGAITVIFRLKRWVFSICSVERRSMSFNDCYLSIIFLCILKRISCISGVSSRELAFLTLFLIIWWLCIWVSWHTFISLLLRWFNSLSLSFEIIQHLLHIHLYTSSLNFFW